jgi:hypothetical protein
MSDAVFAPHQLGSLPMSQLEGILDFLRSKFLEDFTCDPVGDI